MAFNKVLQFLIKRFSNHDQEGNFGVLFGQTFVDLENSETILVPLISTHVDDKRGFEEIDPVNMRNSSQRDSGGNAPPTRTSSNGVLPGATVTELIDVDSTCVYELPLCAV